MQVARVARSAAPRAPSWRWQVETTGNQAGALMLHSLPLSSMVSRLRAFRRKSSARSSAAACRAWFFSSRAERRLTFDSREFFSCRQATRSSSSLPTCSFRVEEEFSLLLLKVHGAATGALHPEPARRGHQKVLQSKTFLQLSNIENILGTADCTFG